MLTGAGKRCAPGGAIAAAATLLLTTCLIAPQARGQEEAAIRTWSVAPYFGMNQPKLDALNKGEFQAPYEGGAQFVDPVANNTDGTFTYNTPLAPFNPGTLTGLEFQWRINDKHSFLVGASTWQATSTAASTGLFPIQGAFELVNARRTVNLSYNEFFLGWRYNLFSRPNSYRFYVSASLHHLYDIDYREDFTGVFLSGDVRQFRKSLIIRAQTTGLPLLEGTAGGEWFVTNWLSLGIEGGYDIGLKDIELQGVGTTPITSDFLATDNVQLRPPMIMDFPTRNMTHKSVSGGDYEVTRLDFSGWRLVMKATFYF
ncbi:MAG: hypothetical protein IT488_08535 [Gammaproteobacteria bacterium]|nr:hypothetical protein [Gammaproteobacteria bacterium]